VWGGVGGGGGGGGGGWGCGCVCVCVYYNVCIYIYTYTYIYTHTYQASVHDIHLGSLEEYPAHINRLALYLSQVNARVFFRSGDALHMPPAHILKSTRCSDFYMVYGH
jgi:hypothetical protein